MCNRDKSNNIGAMAQGVASLLQRRHTWHHAPIMFESITTRQHKVINCVVALMHTHSSHPILLNSGQRNYFIKISPPPVL